MFLIPALFLYLKMIYFFSNLKTTTMSKVLCFLIIVSFIGIGSCKKEITDPAFCGTAWSLQLTDELTALTNAAMAYSSDPTPTTCNAYKTAYQGYLDALKPFLDCSAWTAAEKADLEEEIADAEADISTLCD